MRSSRIALALFLLFPTLAAAQNTDRDAVFRLDSLWARMYATNDTVTADKLYADDVVFTSTNGAHKDKRTEMADVRPTAGLKLEYFRTTGTAVRMHGSTAVVTGIAEWRFTMNDQPNEARRSYTHVYVKGGPLGWRIVAVHMGRAP